MGAGGRWPIIALLAILLLMLFSPVLGSFDFEVPVKPVSIRETRISAYEEKLTLLGATCTFRIIGPMGVYYANDGFLAMLNETVEFVFEVEVSNAPSGFKLNIEEAHVYRGCLFGPLGMEIFNETLVRGLVVTEGQPLRTAFSVRVYELEPWPIGGLESCGMRVKVYGNATFGENVEKLDPHEMRATVYALKPEDDLKVDVKPIILLDYEGRRLQRIFFGADVTITNNLGSDMVLRGAEMVICDGPCPAYGGWIRETWNLNKLIRRGESGALELNSTRFFSLGGMMARSGALLVRLKYLTEMGEHEKTIAFHYDVSDARPLRAAAGGGEAAASTTTGRTSLGPAITQQPVEDVARALSRGLPWAVLIVCLIFFLTGAIFVTTRRRRGAKGSAPSSEAPQQVVEQPVKMELPSLDPPPIGVPAFLSLLYTSYQKFVELVRRDRPTEALLALVNGMYNALRQWARSAGLIELPSSGDVFNDAMRYAGLLHDYALLTTTEFDIITRMVFIARDCAKKPAPSLMLEVARLYSELYTPLLGSFSPPR